jgi:hypothetical protein
MHDRLVHVNVTDAVIPVNFSFFVTYVSEM